MFFNYLRAETRGENGCIKFEAWNGHELKWGDPGFRNEKTNFGRVVLEQESSVSDGTITHFGSVAKDVELD